MKIRRLLCLVAPHRWAPATDVHEGVLVLRCRRCGREEVRSAETFGTEPWGERWARQEFVDDAFIDARTWDPRIRERRR
jgi:hypothetical protein